MINKLASSQIAGATNGTFIGNVGDKLKVDASISAQTEAGTVFSTAVHLNMATSGTVNPLVLFRNPSGSAKTIHIWDMAAGVNVNNVNAVFSIYSSPTVSANGSAVTTGTRKIGSGLSAVALVTSLPTITSNGVLLESAVSGQNTNSVLLATNFSIVIPENNSILITGNPSSNNREAIVSFKWVEL